MKRLNTYNCFTIANGNNSEISMHALFLLFFNDISFLRILFYENLCMYLHFVYLNLIKYYNQIEKLLF